MVEGTVVDSLALHYHSAGPVREALRTEVDRVVHLVPGAFDAHE